MEHDKRDDSTWVDRRLASLDPPDQWRPDAGEALARLRHRDVAGKPARPHRWWLWASLSATAAAAGLGLLMLSTPPACANPLGCTGTAPSRQASSFKQSGSPAAPVTLEVYTDYECPHCASFYLETLPQLVAGYVETGKVRLIHRDYPLPLHQYARLAARYANAAGEAGFYDEAAAQLFRTQALWSADGNIDQALAQVAPPAIMQKIRDKVRNGPVVDPSVAADEAMALVDHLQQTPTLVVVSNGNRQVIGGELSFSLLKAYLDQLPGVQ